MEKDTSCSLPAIREDITATTDLPPQLPSPPQITDIIIDKSSERSLGTENIEHLPLDPAHSPYDIV